MNKLEIAARQALEALEQNTYYNFDDDIKALREALDHQADEIDWIETNKALAKEIIELKKQAEREPMFFGLTHDHTWLSISEQQYNKLKPNGRMKLYAAPVSIALQSETDSSSSSMRTTVRTKDLTDDEIAQFWAVDGFYQTPTNFARAVIAADRELNK